MRFEPKDYVISRYDASKEEGILNSFTDENALHRYVANLRSFADLSESPLPMILSSAQAAHHEVDLFMRWLETYATTTYIDEEFFLWKVLTKGQSHMTITQSLYNDGDCIGVGTDTFEIPLDIEGLHAGDVLAPLSSGTLSCQIRLVDDGIRVGSNVIYKAESWGMDEGNPYDVRYLKAGQKWKYLYHPLGEATSRRGSIHHNMGSGWIEFGGNMMTIGTTMKVTDKATKYLTYTTCDPSGRPKTKQPDYIINELEVAFIAETKKHEKNVILYSTPVSKPLTASRYRDLSSGYYVNSTVGFIPYMQKTNILEYNIDSYDVDIVKNELTTMANQRIGYSNWDWTFAGGLGFIEVNQKDLQKKYAGKGVTVMQGDVTRPGEAYAKNRQGLILSDPQITGFDFGIFGTVRFIHLPEFDSGEFGGWELMYKGKPISSYWGFCMSLHLNGQRKKNFEILRKKRSTAFTYINGTVGPEGFINNFNGRGMVSSHQGGWYDMEWQTTLGFRADNLNDMLWMVPNLKA